MDIFLRKIGDSEPQYRQRKILELKQEKATQKERHVVNQALVH